MDADARAFFEQVLETPSPSGYESPLQQIVRGYAQQFADEVRTDVHGNVIAARNAGASRRVMLAGHCDQIGLYVQYVDTEGFVYVQALGGWDTQVLLGQRMTVWSRHGPVTGVIARKAIHLLTEDEKKQVPKLKDMWLDIGCKSREEAEGLVRVGDPITLELVARELRNGLMASPAMDDKCGMWVVLEALRRIDAGKLQWAVYAVSTVQEEVGLRGAKTSAYGIDPEVGIAVDVTHATDSPTMDKKQDGDVALGRGPVVYRGPNMNPKLVERLIEAAGTHQIPYQLGASGRPPGTDANVIQLSRAGVATGLVSIPNRYMHSPVEVISLEDIDRAADLLARTIEDLPGDFDFTP
ncbi:MAG: M42 family metallopeptidase [Thermoguttaceae bacterium]|nr:M42 family metallopeptidase [Thermoguttaceae bacterium]